MEENTEVMTLDNISKRVYMIRGQQVMRAFREMRHYIKQNKQFVTQSELRLVTAKVSEMSVQVAGLADRQQKTEQSVENIQKSIDILNENFVSDKDFKNFVIYKGQKFEADAGKKLCAINKIADTSMIHPVMDKLLLNPDRTI